MPMSQEEKISQLQEEIRTIKLTLLEKENHLKQLLLNKETVHLDTNLSGEEICRYSRQMLIPEISVNGQLALKKSKVLVIGAGGLGCPVALYLAAAGVGHISIVDEDNVEMSNLHRQVLHTENDIGTPKVESAFKKLTRLNSKIELVPLKLHASSDSIQDIISKTKFDVVVDGTDNVASRYLLNDVCVLNDLPLVSGSALQLEGQLTVYHCNGGPCYRCLFPKPPPPECVTSCGDGGVLGPVPGVIGILQALETIKIITGMPDVLSGRLLTFDGSNTTFRNIKLRNRNTNCDVCGDNPTIKSLIDYEQFCGAKACDKVTNIEIVNKDEIIGVKEFSKICKDSLVIDVRPSLEYVMCNLPNTVNIPYSDIQKGNGIDRLQDLLKHRRGDSAVYVICRRGNDSQRSIVYLKEKIPELPAKFVNVSGGLHAYSKYVDNSFPIY